MKNAALLLCAALLAGCASSGVRYTDDQGRTYAGSVDPLTNTMTADIAGKRYRGPYTVNDWGQGKATLAGPGDEKLYCNFAYRLMKVKGTCATYGGYEYHVESLQR
jgi:hypothetical protein